MDNKSISSNPGDLLENIEKLVVDKKIKEISDLMMNMVNYAYLLEMTNTLKSIEIFDDEDRKHILHQIRTVKKQISDEGKRIKKNYGHVYHLFINMSTIAEVRQQILQKSLQNISQSSPLFHYFLNKQVSLNSSITQMKDLLKQ